ncbi:hypothetical protein BU17DRAFT_54381, partial [Hysterangium stoloniferum]
IRAQFRGGSQCSVLPALTLEGYIATPIVPGSVNAAELIDFIVGDVVSFIHPLSNGSIIILF